MQNPVNLINLYVIDNKRELNNEISKDAFIKICNKKYNLSQAY